MVVWDDLPVWWKTDSFTYGDCDSGEAGTGPVPGERIGGEAGGGISPFAQPLGENRLAIVKSVLDEVKKRLDSKGCSDFLNSLIANISKDRDPAYANPSDMYTLLSNAKYFDNPQHPDFGTSGTSIGEVWNELLGSYMNVTLGEKFFNPNEKGLILSNKGEVLGDQASILIAEAPHLGWWPILGGITDMTLAQKAGVPALYSSEASENFGKEVYKHCGPIKD
jgi:hypothetical protein